MTRKTLVLAACLALIVGAGVGCTCFQVSYRTDFKLLNSCQSAIYPDGGSALELGESRSFRVQHASIRDVDIQRPEGTHAATLVVTSFYELEDHRKKGVTITITESTYGTFAASSSDAKLHVRVDNF